MISMNEPHDEVAGNECTTGEAIMGCANVEVNGVRQERLALYISISLECISFADKIGRWIATTCV